MGNICLDCGLCCDGTLFTHVENTDIKQPCPHFCGLCSIYESRPDTCRKFECKLITDQVPEDEARKVINNIKTRIENLCGDKPYRDMIKELMTDSTSYGKDHFKTKSMSMGIETLIRTHFKDFNSGRVTFFQHYCKYVMSVCMEELSNPLSPEIEENREEIMRQLNEVYDEVGFGQPTDEQTAKVEELALSVDKAIHYQLYLESKSSGEGTID